MFLRDAHSICMSAQLDALQHTGKAGCGTEMCMCEIWLREREEGFVRIVYLEAAFPEYGEYPKSEFIRQWRNCQNPEGKTVQNLTRTILF